MFFAYLILMHIPQAKDAVTHLNWAIEAMGYRVFFNPETDEIDIAQFK